MEILDLKNEESGLDKIISETQERLKYLMSLKNKLDEADDENLLTVFGNKIKQLRIDNNLSQEDFASITQVSRGYVSKLENGKLNPSYTAFLRIVTNLGLNTDEILDFMLDNIKVITEQNKKNL